MSEPGRRLLEAVRGRLPDRARERFSAARSRARRVRRRELSEFRRWIQTTANLLHLSVVFFVPAVIGFVTYLSNHVQTLSFLLFPPLASGTYTLFSDPEGRYANPIRFVASLSVGALCGLIAQTATVWFSAGGAPGVVRPETAALAIFLTGLVTWGADVEAPSAFATALLALVTGEVDPTTYVVSVVLASSIVAAAFVVWREEFYEKRASFLYETVRGDDHVLVPVRGDTGEQTAFFGARLAAAHEAGKVVLLDIVSPSTGPAGSEAGAGEEERGGADRGGGGRGAAERSHATTDDRIRRLEGLASTLRTRVGVPCEVAVAEGEAVTATMRAARNANCDLVVAPYEEDRGALSDFVRGVFGGDLDAVAFRSVSERRRWTRVLVLVARPGDTAHAMIDFATRLSGGGTVSVTTCIGSESERRPAETNLDRLVETAEGTVETRVARSPVEDFIAANADAYDLLVIGSSGDRSPASRFVAPPTFQRLQSVECDVAVFDRGSP
ncbi:universal stress protein [Halobellus sp. GM3]|uniref:universal stress protein n=1 Tax=Halobellus sp. GM3 TaxID=3458410 RepID=UPI00403D5FED